MPLTDVQTVILALGATVVALAAIGRYVVMPLFRLARATWRFLEDWNGRPAHGGEDAVPGVMERVHRIEAEVTHNGGSSLKDAVVRTETTLKAHLDESESAKAAAREESTEMWRAINAVANATPPETQ